MGSPFNGPVYTRALWNWDTSQSPPVVSGWGGQPTKTGLLPADLQSFVGVPLSYYGNPSTPVPSTTQIQWIRWAEDWVEQETNLLLTGTSIASPPALTQAEVGAIGIVVSSGSGGIQQIGMDYDLEDAAYDFFFERAQNEGWMYQMLRYRPIRRYMDFGVNMPALQNYTAVTNVAYIYPLLSEFFAVPPSWYVEDRDFGLIRLVPAANVQMLPLFAMQLAFMGFAASVPGGIWFQYQAGLTNNDYLTKFSFVKQLVLATAAVQALQSIQGTVNLGIVEQRVIVDGLQYGTRYDARGAYIGLIDQFSKMRDALKETAKGMVTGPMLIAL